MPSSYFVTTEDSAQLSNPMTDTAVAASDFAPEFEFARADFERVRALIHARAGISLHAGKQAMVYSRLSRRLRETGHRRFGDYLQWLEGGRHDGSRDAEWQQFVNCLTTNLTSFFREPHHFEALRAELQPRTGQRLRLWCNAASTGEEPYSIAMVLAEALGPRADARVLATDIDTQVLSAAQRGVYAADSRGLAPERLRLHFLRGTGRNAGSIRVRPEVAASIQFQRFNLIDEEWSFDEPFDIVFCRNVMIYFDASTQLQVLRRMHAVMRPGALLFAGHSENFSNAATLFRLRGKTIYERL